MVMGFNTVHPLVSIGIATYNRPKLLHRVLERITKQTYKNLEIVISDDFSPGKETQKVVYEFMENDPRIKYYCQEINLGQARNFNFVFQKASGDYFMWSADDDYFDTDNLVAKLVSEVVDSDCMLAFPNINYVDEHDNQIRKNELSAVFKDCETDYEYLIALVNSGTGFPAYGLFNLKKISTFQLDIRFDEDINYYNEGSLLHRTFLHGKVKFVEDVYVNYISGRGNNTPHRIKYPILVLDFVKYSTRLFTLVGHSDLSLLDKKNIFAILFKKKGWTLVRLLFIYPLRFCVKFVTYRTKKS
jgi:glycosyltransferase involved in cell wall biosynthesis